MKNIEDINREAVKKITSNKKITNFAPGDTIKVGVKIVEGKRERIQFFEGVCIAKKNRDINSSFTVRKISFGEGVERTFALYSPIVDSVKVIRSGNVRRAKSVSYTHLRAHETRHDLVCRLLLEKKKETPKVETKAEKPTGKKK